MLKACSHKELNKSPIQPKQMVFDFTKEFCVRSGSISMYIMAHIKEPDLHASPDLKLSSAKKRYRMLKACSYEEVNISPIQPKSMAFEFTKELCVRSGSISMFIMAQEPDLHASQDLKLSSTPRF